MLERQQAEAWFVASDVTGDEGAVAELAAAVEERCGLPLHVLFNNVGGLLGRGRSPAKG